MTPKRNNAVLRVVTKQIIPMILLFALYVQFHGEYGPGGGFQAGVIFAAGFVLYALVFGLDLASRAMPARALFRIAPLGVLLFAGVGVYSLLKGYAFLDYTAIDPHDPVHAQHLGILIIELGVGLTVFSVLLLIFYAFAGRRRADSLTHKDMG